MPRWKRWLSWVCAALVAWASLTVPAAPAAPADPAATVAPAAPADAVIEFNRDVRPILSDKCFACHGFDPKHRKARLRLDTFEGATRERAGTRAVVPGNLDESELWARVSTGNPEIVMPPPSTNKKLTDAEKQVLRRWIEQGARYQQHWSFEPIRRPQVPPAMPPGGRNAIDAFLHARLVREGLTFSPEADKPTLIRRVAFALTGLPPSLDEVEAFLADGSPDAYEKMVDRYLASDHYGEEMARHWLDVARYADTHGLHLDNERQMWAYRDWVVRAFNDNLRFDRFTVEQLAGDLLPDPTRQQLTATGFNRCNVTTGEGGSIDAEYIFRYAVDRASTTMSAWMGLTGGCAVCHDHKFDPISTKEFYSFYAFFHSNADPAMDGNAMLTRPTIKLPTPEQEKLLAELGARLASKRKELEARTAALDYTDPATLDPRPPVEQVRTVWLDDDFPAGASVQANPGHPTTWVTAADAGAQVLTGKRALRRRDKGLAQDYYHAGAPPLEVPVDGAIFAHVFLDPADPPRAIMLQFHKGDWNHRAVWGEHDVIQWGRPGTHERVHMGPIPDAGHWVRLEVPIARLGLSPGDQLAGFALTQYGGTVYWDQVGITGRSDPAADPGRSLLAWWKLRQGKDTPDVPADLNRLLKAGPEKTTKPEDRKRVRDHYLQNVCRETRPLLAEHARALADVRKQRDDLDASIPGTFVYNDLPKPRDSFVMIRGAYDKPGEKVEPGVPAFLPPLKLDKQRRATRLDLAKWLVSPEHPLTARVAVNRLWQQFFGVGLVKSSEDFGSQGEPPSHPELLDHLAALYRDGGWDTKAMVRLMVTSAAFRQSSVVRPEVLARDPENRLYARGPRFRLDAEQIRDNVLFVSGLIDLTMGGRGVNPYQPPNIWEPVGFVGSNTRFYRQDKGPALYRRTIYTFFKRTAPHPLFANFDAPNREQSCARRERSNTPLQALQLMNDVQHVEAARALAQRMMTEGGTTPEGRVAHAYRLVLARPPEAEETAILLDQLARHLERYRADEPAARKLISHGESKPRPDLPSAELAAYTMVASTVLNLDETLNRN